MKGGGTYALKNANMEVIKKENITNADSLNGASFYVGNEKIYTINIITTNENNTENKVIQWVFDKINKGVIGILKINTKDFLLKHLQDIYLSYDKPLVGNSNSSNPWGLNELSSIIKLLFDYSELINYNKPLILKLKNDFVEVAQGGNLDLQNNIIEYKNGSLSIAEIKNGDPLQFHTITIPSNERLKTPIIINNRIPEYYKDLIGKGSIIETIRRY